MKIFAWIWKISCETINLDYKGGGREFGFCSFVSYKMNENKEFRQKKKTLASLIKVDLKRKLL